MNIRILAAALAMATAAFPTVARAGNYDCSVVYDEYDSLMNKVFLDQPGRYVPVVEGRISHDEYNSRQKGIFLLSGDRTNWRIGIVRTNSNTRGKFLYTWAATAGQPTLVLRDVVLYGRVMDGADPRRTARIDVASSFTVDLDTGAVGGGNAADLWFHNVDGRTMFVEAVNGAVLAFPMDSMCRR